MSRYLSASYSIHMYVRYLGGGHKPNLSLSLSFSRGERQTDCRRMSDRRRTADRWRTNGAHMADGGRMDAG